MLIHNRSHHALLLLTIIATKVVCRLYIGYGRRANLLNTERSTCRDVRISANDGSNSEQREFICRSKSTGFALLAASRWRRCTGSGTSVEHNAPLRTDHTGGRLATGRRRWYPDFTTDHHRHRVPVVAERCPLQPAVAAPNSGVQLVWIRCPSRAPGRRSVAGPETSTARASLRLVRSCFVAAVDHVVVIEVNEVTGGSGVAGSGLRCWSEAGGTVDRVRVRRALVQELHAGVRVGSLSPVCCSSGPVDDGCRTPSPSRLELLDGGSGGGGRGEGGRHHRLRLG